MSTQDGAAMILGTGVDMCEIAGIASAIARRGDRFLGKLFTPAECSALKGPIDPGVHFARLFAAKEACAKALGAGFGDGVAWRDFEIIPDTRGAPRVTMTGGARRELARLCPAEGARTHISWRHDAAFATAVVVIEALN